LSKTAFLLTAFDKTTGELLDLFATDDEALAHKALADSKAFFAQHDKPAQFHLTAHTASS